MNKTKYIDDLKYFILVLCLLLIGCNKNTDKSNADPFPYVYEDQKTENDFDFLFERIVDLQKQNLLVGAEVLIIRNDTILLHDVVGRSDKEKGIKLKKNSIYRIRSMTKPIVATAILILLDEGKLSLEDRVASYIPAFDNSKSREITVLQLLTHTGGLKSHDYDEIGLSKPPHEFETLSEVVDEIGQIGVIGEPGKFYYSGSGIATLTRLITIASGIPAETFIQQRIFKPLNMSDSYTLFYPGVAWATSLNPTYEWNDSTNNFTQYWNPTLEPEYKYFRGHGGVYTTAMDYAKFLSLHLNNGSFNKKQILSEGIMAKAQSILVPLPLKAPQSHQSLVWKTQMSDTSSKDIGYYKHGGSDGTLAYAYPKENTIALYFNQSRNHPRFIFEDLLSITPPYDAYRKWNYNNEYLDQWKEILHREEKVQSKALDKQFETYLGTYKCINNDGFNSEILKKNDQIIIKNLRSGNEITLNHYQKNEFICRFRPPPDGFISKVIFSKNHENSQSFTLEWLNKTKFEFEKIK
jgi:CubicO group peptidase (beta-lactamase class C family)